MTSQPLPSVATRAMSPATSPWSLAALFFVALVPLLSTPLLPFIDLYNHLSRYFVLGHLAGSPLLRQSYAANWGLLPNIGLDVVCTALLKVVPPRLAAHVVVTIILAVQYGGVLTFNRVLTGRWSMLVAVLLVPLLYSFILNWGFANFLCGLGLVFWGAAWWLRWRDRLIVGLPISVLIAIAIFLTHGLTFALYGVVVASLELGGWRERRDRRLAGLLMALIPVVAQAIIPVALFLSGRIVQSSAGITNADAAVTRLAASGRLASRISELVAHRLTTIVRVAEGPSLAFDVVTFVLAAIVVATMLRRGDVRLPPVVWPALAAATVLVVVTPPMLFGVGYVADRMPLFFALLFVASLAVEVERPLVQTATLILGAIAAVRLVAIIAGWQVYGRLNDEFDTVAAQIPPGSLVDQLLVGGAPRDTPGLRYAMFGPLTIARHGQIGPLFANESEQPLRLIGRLRAAAEALPNGSAAGNLPLAAYDVRLAAIGPAGFDYVLVTHAEWLTRPLPAVARVVARTPHFLLLDVRKPR